MTRRLVLVRHGQTAWNLSGRAQGHTDVALDATGRTQAAVMAAQVATLCPSVLWSSDLSRASQTAGYIAAQTGLEVHTDARLREFDVGERAGLTAAGFAERFPVAFDAWRHGHLTGNVPGAETTEQVRDRMLPALLEVWSAAGPGQTVVVVSHGACLKVCTAALLDTSRGPGASDLRSMGNCGWTVLEEGPSELGFRLVSYNAGATLTRAAPDFATGQPVG